MLDLLLLLLRKLMLSYPSLYMVQQRTSSGPSIAAISDDIADRCFSKLFARSAKCFRRDSLILHVLSYESDNRAEPHTLGSAHLWPSSVLLRMITELSMRRRGPDITSTNTIVLSRKFKTHSK